MRKETSWGLIQCAISKFTGKDRQQTSQTLNEDIQCPDRDKNTVTSEYKTDSLRVKPVYSTVTFMWGPSKVQFLDLTNSLLKLRSYKQVISSAEQLAACHDAPWSYKRR